MSSFWIHQECRPACGHEQNWYDLCCEEWPSTGGWGATSSRARRRYPIERTPQSQGDCRLKVGVLPCVGDPPRCPRGHFAWFYMADEIPPVEVAASPGMQWPVEINREQFWWRYRKPSSQPPHAERPDEVCTGPYDRTIGCPPPRGPFANRWHQFIMRIVGWPLLWLRLEITGSVPYAVGYPGYTGRCRMAVGFVDVQSWDWGFAEINRDGTLWDYDPVRGYCQTQDTSFNLDILLPAYCDIVLDWWMMSDVDDGPPRYGYPVATAMPFCERLHFTIHRAQLWPELPPAYGDGQRRAVIRLPVWRAQTERTASLTHTRSALWAKRHDICAKCPEFNGTACALVFPQTRDCRDRARYSAGWNAWLEDENSACPLAHW